jgi:hypothetical protein
MRQQAHGVAVLDHLVPAFGRSSSLDPIAPPDSMILPNGDIRVPNASNENPILRALPGLAGLAGFGVLVYSVYRASTRRPSEEGEA